jgi:hypothetical protein
MELHDWHEVLGKNGYEEVEANISDSQEIPSIASKGQRYSSTHDWNAIECNMEMQQKSEKPQGKESMNQLLQKIYRNWFGDDTPSCAPFSKYVTRIVTFDRKVWS